MRVLLIDDDPDLCGVMLDLFSAFSVEHFQALHSFDQLSRLHNLSEFQMRRSFFTGHAQSHPQIKDILQTKRVSLLEKPVSIEELQNLLKR